LINLSLLDLDNIERIAKEAGRAILTYYNSSDEISYNNKSDQSPLTLADIKSHNIICDALKKSYPNIPILSEEGSLSLDSCNLFWCVDPLDGTKEFIKKNGEFTVNIALICKEQPVLGVVHVPFFNVSYSALKKYGAFKIENGLKHKLAINNNNRFSPTKFAISRSHINEETKKFIKLNNAETISAGSALKLTLVAEGKVDAYPRFGPTSLWDIAAGHIIIKETGGNILDLNFKELIYNSKKILNPSFIAIKNRAHTFAHH
jgi:3'(2'), 5'-bisphosphate nucleotidase